MQTWEKVLIQMVGASGFCFAWLIAVDLGILPDNLRGDGVLFHWQVWMLTGIVLLVTRDFVSQVQRDRRSGLAGLPEALRPHWTRRPAKTWLPASWTSTTQSRRLTP